MRHLLIAAMLLLGVIARAQTQGNAPFLIDSANDFENSSVSCTGNPTSGPSCVNYPENLVVGDVLVAVEVQQDVAACGGGSGSNPPWTFADTQSNVWHNQTAVQPQTPNGSFMQMSIMQVANPGAAQITVGTLTPANCAQTLTISRYKNASINLDGSLVNTTSSTGTTSPIGFSTSTTTTVNGDLLVSAGTQFLSPGGTVRTDGGVLQYATYNGHFNNGFTDTLMGWAAVGNIGSYSMGMAIFGGSAVQRAFMQTIALKPAVSNSSPAIAVATTALPDAASGVAYSAPVACLGGTVAPTFTLFSGSLPA